ncbi:MAG: hypothetical protein HC876_22035 [Chloroflexaceae bacterium]|nr:hypothetical protein [Chloroflexaceae bacterium]
MYQIAMSRAVAINSAKEGHRLRLPGQACELVCGCQQQSRALAVNIVIDQQGRDALSGCFAVPWNVQAGRGQTNTIRSRSLSMW